MSYRGSNFSSSGAGVSTEVFKMAPLFKTALLRTFGFLLWAFFSAWLFYVVEYTEKDNQEEKYQLLHSLYVSMTSKYNMTIEEFNNFSSIAYEALSEPKPQWTYSVSVNFVFQAFTTIGKDEIANIKNGYKVVNSFIKFENIQE